MKKVQICILLFVWSGFSVYSCIFHVCVSESLTRTFVHVHVYCMKPLSTCTSVILSFRLVVMRTSKAEKNVKLHTHTHVYVHVHTCMYMYIHVYVHVHTCIYVHVHVSCYWKVSCYYVVCVKRRGWIVMPPQHYIFRLFVSGMLCY